MWSSKLLSGWGKERAGSGEGSAVVQDADGLFCELRHQHRQKPSRVCKAEKVAFPFHAPERLGGSKVTHKVDDGCGILFLFQKMFESSFIANIL